MCSVFIGGSTKIPRTKYLAHLNAQWLSSYYVDFKFLSDLLGMMGRPLPAGTDVLPDKPVLLVDTFPSST